MGLLQLLKLYLCGVILVMVYLLHRVESTVVIRFVRAPPVLSKSSVAVFRYVVERPDGRNACKNSSCSVSCEFDGRSVLPCPMNTLELKNLTESREHELTLTVTTGHGERNSSTFSWFIDTTPPTATISSDQNYTNAKTVTVQVAFSEPCNGNGGFKCTNASHCDVIIYGPATVVPSSLHMVENKTKFSLNVSIAPDILQCRIIITMADQFCTDEAGNEFVRTNESTLIIRIDREPVRVDLWAPIPSYALAIDGIPRTVYATNNLQGTEIYLDFSIAVVNSTEQMLSALCTNVGILVPSFGRNNGNRRFVFEMKNISGTHIIEIKLQAGAVICKTGAVVSSVISFTFLFDTSKPVTDVRTPALPITKDSRIDTVVGFTEPVFGFESSMVDVEGGRVVRFKELSRDLYLVTILAAASRNMISVTVPEAKVHDISGNSNLASNKLEVMHYSVPAASIALQSFVTVGIVATSLTAALLSISSSNLGAFSPQFGDSGISSSLQMNLHGMIGHLQVFVLSDWLSTGQPIEFLETTKGLQWLIPRQRLPWKRDSATSSPGQFYKEGKKLNRHNVSHSAEVFAHGKNANLILQNYVPMSASGLRNMSKRDASYGLPLTSGEYLMYFTRGEPLSATYRIEGLESHWWEDMEMNLFWVAVGGGSLIIIHLLILLFLKLRTGAQSQGVLSVPRFELLLLILLLPGISQSSAFAIKGERTEGILLGTLLLAIPIAFVLSLSLFLAFVIFPSSFAQYKEVKHLSTQEPWYKKLLSFLIGPPAHGKWFFREGIPSSFSSLFGTLFKDLKGPAFYVFDQNDASTMPKWTESSESGIGRMRAVSSADTNEDVKIPILQRLFGCARSSYIVLDISRRITLGFLAGIYPFSRPKRLVCALSITLLQFIYLVTLKPYISRGIQVVESVSLLCEAGVFLLLTITRDMNVSAGLQPMFLGLVLMALLLICFMSQIIREWYAMVRLVLRLSRSQEGSFKVGLKNVAKGLVLPFLPRHFWSRLLNSDNELQRVSTRVPCVESLSLMTATVVPMRSPVPGSQATNIGQRRSGRAAEPSSSRPAGDERTDSKESIVEPRSDLKRLRELAKASFSG